MTRIHSTFATIEAALEEHTLEEVEIQRRIRG